MANPGSTARAHTTSVRKTTGSRQQRLKEAVKTINFDFPWNKQNAVFLGIGIGTLIIGYILMATSVGKDAKWDTPLAITVAPIVLSLAYVVLIPLAIMRRPRKDETTDDANS